MESQVFTGGKHDIMSNLRVSIYLLDYVWKRLYLSTIIVFAGFSTRVCKSIANLDRKEKATDITSKTNNILILHDRRLQPRYSPTSIAICFMLTIYFVVCCKAAQSSTSELFIYWNKAVCRGNDSIYLFNQLILFIDFIYIFM